MAEETIQVSGPDELEARLADYFKLLGCASRIHILRVLLRGEAGMEELSEGIQMSPSALSHQLRILREQNWCGRGGPETTSPIP